VVPLSFTQWLKLATSNLVHSLGLPRPTIKPHLEEKWAWPCVKEAPIYLGSSIIFLQRPHCPLSVSGAPCHHRYHRPSFFLFHSGLKPNFPHIVSLSFIAPLDSLYEVNYKNQDSCSMYFFCFSFASYFVVRVHID